MAFDSVQFIVINPRFKHGCDPVQIMIELIVCSSLLLRKKLKLSKLSPTYGGSLITLCSDILISSYFLLLILQRAT